MGEFYAIFCQSTCTPAIETFLYGFVLQKWEIGSKWNENGEELKLEWSWNLNWSGIGRLFRYVGALLTLAVPEWPQPALVSERSEGGYGILSTVFGFTGRVFWRGVTIGNFATDRFVF